MTTPQDPSFFRTVLGHYPTGVCIVTAVDPTGARVGMTVGTFTSVSLDPPLVAFFPDRKSSTWARIAATEKFCVNVLAHDQMALCRQFASRVADKFEGVTHTLSPSGMPIIDDVVAWLDCDRYAVHEAGDHEIVLGRVTALAVLRAVHPLVFLRGSYGRFSPLE